MKPSGSGGGPGCRRCLDLVGETFRLVTFGTVVSIATVTLTHARKAHKKPKGHGGMGYAEEYPVSRYFVDARVLSVFEGADETLCLKVITRGLLAEEGLVH